MTGEPAVRAFVQGEGGGWRFEDDFPPPARARRFFIQDEGRLGETPAASGTDRYHALHTVGVTSGLWSPMPMALDYPQDQRRDDALSLCYTSSPLAAALEIAGRPVMRLAVTPSWDDPTLVVKLCDVAPDGASALVTTGWLALRTVIERAARADRHPTSPPPRSESERSAGVAGQRCEVEIPLWSTAYRFAAGHRVRVSIACSDFPRLWPGRGSGTIEIDRARTELRLPAVAPDRGPAGVPSFDPPDLMALLSEGPLVFVPSWRVEIDVVQGTVGTRAGLEMKFMTPTGAFIESHHDYVARAGCRERAEATLDAECTLDVTQDGDVISVHASERMTESQAEFGSSLTVNGKERYRREWQRSWRSP